jgi:23S rRNA pseudouridine2457 synthase
MTAAVGHPTLRLVRAALGPLHLAHLGLQPGQWRELRPDEERALRESASGRRRGTG